MLSTSSTGMNWQTLWRIAASSPDSRRQRMYSQPLRPDSGGDGPPGHQGKSQQHPIRRCRRGSRDLVVVLNQLVFLLIEGGLFLRQALVAGGRLLPPQPGPGRQGDPPAGPGPLRRQDILRRRSRRSVLSTSSTGMNWQTLQISAASNTTLPAGLPRRRRCTGSSPLSRPGSMTAATGPCPPWPPPPTAIFWTRTPGRGRSVPGVEGLVGVSGVVVIAGQLGQLRPQADQLEIELPGRSFGPSASGAGWTARRF